MKRLTRLLRSRECLLIGMIVLCYLIFYALLGDSYAIDKLLNQTRVYMADVGFMAVGITLVLIMGDIDISLASIAALSVTIMGIAHGAGLGFELALVLALLVGAACGFINGFLVIRFKELFPMIITLGTQTLYRGIAYILLKDQAARGFPAWFSKTLGYGSIGNIPYLLICVLAIFPICYVVMHHTAYGRQIFATGTNATAARYSGIRTDRIKLTMFTVCGLLSAIAGVVLVSRTGSVKYSIGEGYEMLAISIAVLGGAASGRASVPGLLLALIMMTCLKTGLMLLFNDSFILNMAVGLLLILVILLPNVPSRLRRRGDLRLRRAQLVRKSSGT